MSMVNTMNVMQLSLNPPKFIYVGPSPTNLTLFPYGVDVGDVLAPPAIDDAFGPVHMDYPIVIFQNSETSFYVS